MTQIDGYDDIHDNVRYWLGELVRRATQNVASDRHNGAVVLYDIGANEGQLSIPIAVDHRTEMEQHGNGGLRIVAFEPLARARARFIQNATDAGLSYALWGDADATLIPVALGDRDELVEIEVFSDDTFSTVHHRSPEELERYHLEMTGVDHVRMRRLDDLVASEVVVPPNLVKIDVEGAERFVLNGAAETLRQFQPIILMEFSCINVVNAGYTRGELIDTLRSYGYKRFFGLFRNTDRELRSEAEFEDCRIWNVIAVSDTL